MAIGEKSLVILTILIACIKKTLSHTFLYNFFFVSGINVYKI